MPNGYPPLEVKVWGELACFTDPSQKVDRVSYPVMTPSAARGVLEAIFWHKPMQWRIREILVLKPIEYIGLMRNEVTQKMTDRPDGLDIVDCRAQRNTLFLKDVAYIIRADVHLPNGSSQNDVVKYRDQFRRRVDNGQCFHRPYLGCRECAAHFGHPTGDEMPIGDDMYLGWILFDLMHSDDRATPRFFEATLQRGVLHVPQELYEELEVVKR
jgi:CRISPR-associated protein Cas5d